MNRRSFIALASGLLAPVPEPVRRYFFAPAGGWTPRRAFQDLSVGYVCSIRPLTAAERARYPDALGVAIADRRPFTRQQVVVLAPWEDVRLL